MTSGDDKGSLVATDMVKLAALFESAFHSHISAASILWEVDGIGFTHVS